jgi:hypothetical protein
MADLNAAEPIEVWLTQSNLEVTCLVVLEDESTTNLDVDSLSIRGAQREITGWLISKGYEPVGRWEQETDGRLEGLGESSRRFRPAKPSPPKFLGTA